MAHRLGLSALLVVTLFASSAFAQDFRPAASPAASFDSSAPRQSGVSRSGFTFLVNLGVGFQSDAFLNETGVGLAGLNAGFGAFLTDRVAVMARFSGTNASFDSLGTNQVSGVFGGSVQYWVTDRFTVEGGVGMGYWSFAGIRDNGLGVIVAAHAIVLSRGRHNLHAGVEYAHAFTDPGHVRNIGVVFGYQFHGVR